MFYFVDDFLLRQESGSEKEPLPHKLSLFSGGKAREIWTEYIIRRFRRIIVV
jgi:hypothetical protein